MAEEEQDFSKLSLEERCQHKNWKARVSAYDELAKLFLKIDDEKSGEWAKYASWVRKFPVDSNAAAQEKALEVALLFLEHAGQNQAARIVSEVMSGVVSKCITASKAKSKELAVSIALMCVEVEKFETVQEELMKGMDHKNPKVMAGSITILTDILRAFGPKVINLKSLLKKIPILIEDRDKTVREETKKLMVELYRWLGAAFKPLLSAVKPLVVQEVEAEVEKFSEKPRQTRYLRSQQVKNERIAEERGDEDNAEGEAVAEDAQPDIDPYELLEPVDILAKLPKDFYEKCEAKKWQDRKEAMEVLETLVANPKLEGGDYADLVRMLKRIIGKDSNVVVVALAGKCIGSLASGLKKKFTPYAPSCISSILEKFKEKKVGVLTAMRDSIDACFACTTLEPIQEDVVQALQGKNPAVKLETNAFLSRAFAKTPLKTMSDKKLMKPYFTAIVTNLNESDQSVREAAAEAFGVALKHLGEKALASFTTDMEPMKLAKVKEFAEKAVITAPKEKGAKPATAAKSNGKSSNAVIRPQKTGNANASKPKTASEPAEYSDEERTPALNANKTTRTGKGTSGTKNGNVEPKAAPSKGSRVAPKTKGSTPTKKTIEEPTGDNLPNNSYKSQRISDEMKLRILKWNFTAPREEFLDLLKELMTTAGLGRSLITNMFHSDFKLHLKAIDILHEEFARGPEGTTANLDLILKWATLRFFDTNPSVLIKILEYLGQVFRTLGEQQYNMPDLEASAFIPYLLLKIGDSKDTVRASVHNILKCLLDVYSAQRIFCYIMEGLRSKNARQRSECLDELGSMIASFGITEMHPSPATALKEIAKQISDRDNGVRNSALNAVVKAYFFDGDKIYKLIGQLPDKDQSLLDERIKRAVKNGPPKPPVTSLTSRVAPMIPAPAAPYSAPPTAVSPLRPPTPTDNAFHQPQNLNATIVYPNENELVPLSDRGYPDSSRLSSTTSRLPEKYRIDFEAIDNMFRDETTISPLELMDTNIDQFLRAETIVLPQRRTRMSSGNQRLRNRPESNIPEPVYEPPQANQSIDLLVTQISSPNLRKAIESCSKLEKMLIDPETSSIMSGRVDTMLSMIALQMRRQQVALACSDQASVGDLNAFFRSVVSILTVLFKDEFLPRRASKDSLKEIIYHLLTLIIDENLELITDAAQIVKLVNVMVVRIIEKADANAITCALIRLLGESLTNHLKHPTRMVELVMKCQWKLLKQYNIWTEKKEYQWDLGGILSEFHAFMRAHPFSSFHTRDTTPLKTIKTLLHALVLHVGCDALYFQLNMMPDLKESEAGIYITKLIQRETARKRSGNAPSTTSVC